MCNKTLWRHKYCVFLITHVVGYITQYIHVYSATSMPVPPRECVMDTLKFQVITLLGPMCPFHRNSHVIMIKLPYIFIDGPLPLQYLVYVL